MKKKLFTLLLCAFAVVSANAYEVKPDPQDPTCVIVNGGDYVVTEVEVDGVIHKEISGKDGNKGLPEDINNFSADEKALMLAAEKLVIKGFIKKTGCFQTDWPKLKTVDMSEAAFEQNTNNMAEVTFYQYNPSDKSYTEVTRKYMTNQMSFNYFKNATTVVLSKYVETLMEKTIDGNNALTTTFTIPASVKYIATQAVLNTPIASIDIPATVEVIDERAFMNAQISALIAVKVNGYTAAKIGAFDRINTVGQTQGDYVNYTTLTFPSDLDEDFFKNINHSLSQETSLDVNAFHDWLKDHLNFEGIESAEQKNGWKQFINSSNTTPTPVPQGEKVVLRTYSDTKALLVPLGFRAYIVTGVTPKAVGNKNNYELILQQIFAIPANTGVILYGEIDERATSFSMSTLPSWDDKNSSDYVAPYDRFSKTVGSYSIKNYMVPTVANTKIFPVYKDMTKAEWESVFANKPSSMVAYYNGAGRKEVSDRNFILANFSGTSLKEAKGISEDEDYVGFFRVKANVTCGPNKAYLSLPKDVYNSAAGAEALVLKPTATDMKFRDQEWELKPSTGNWGKRQVKVVLEAKSGVFEIYDETTGINSVNVESVYDNDYYTLQGVKVSQPQKGVYVKNGKKIIK